MTIPTATECLCGSREATVLGSLGHHLWFRCRDCGLDREASPRDLASLSEALDYLGDEPVSIWDRDEYVSRDLDLDLNGAEEF